MNIVNVGYLSTNYYAIDIPAGKLLVDCGWPGTLPQFSAELKRKGIALAEIRYLLVTHFHPDHAGLVQELKDSGARLILLENQLDFISPLSEMIRPKHTDYREIRQDDNILLKFTESRKFLSDLGLAGEVLPTPGHSDDSVTLVLDEGFAFTGDLTPRFLISAEENRLAAESWDRIYQHKITRVYPGHGG